MGTGRFDFPKIGGEKLGGSDSIPRKSAAKRGVGPMVTECRKTAAGGVGWVPIPKKRQKSAAIGRGRFFIFFPRSGARSRGPHNEIYKTPPPYF